MAVACSDGQSSTARRRDRRASGHEARFSSIGLAVVGGGSRCRGPRVARLGLVREPAARDLQRDGLRDPRRRRRARRRPATSTGARSVVDLRGPRGSTAAAVHADRAGGTRPPRIGAHGRGALLQRHRARPGAARARGRARRGDPPEQERRRRRHGPLARRRPAERRGRRRRRHPGRRASWREPRLSLPGRPGRNVLVPRPPGVGDRGAARPLRGARDRARDSAACTRSPTSWSPSTRSTAPRS